MKLLILILTIMLSACATTYKAERCTVIEGIKVCSTVQIKSRREFPAGLQLSYNAKTGDLEFYADKVQNGSSAAEQFVLGLAKDAVNQYKLKR